MNTKKQTYNYVRIQSLLDSCLLYSGRESGKQYTWAKAGSVVDVDERDVPELLAKRIGASSCCGGNPQGSKIFEIYDE